MSLQNNFPYQRYWCEENVWQLCRRMHGTELYAVVISNANRACALWQQCVADAGQAVIWDYHVVAMERDAAGEWRVFDQDSRLRFPESAAIYFSETFRSDVLKQFAPRFHLIAGDDYLRLFSSDRSHMLDARGNFTKPEPPWPAIVQPNGDSLQDMIDMLNPIGSVKTLDEMRTFCAGKSQFTL